MRVSSSFPVFRAIECALSLCLLSAPAVYADELFILSGYCPPSFEKLDDGNCKLRSLYEFYNSPPGFGGLKTRLPQHQGAYTPQQIDLGRYLFFDPVLSGNKTQSCATCHQPDKGFSDGLARSVGAEGKELARSAPSLWNVGFLKSLFWDGRAETLVEQASGPLFDELEMNNSREKLESTLNGIERYRSMFAVAFPETTKITLAEISQSLAAFQSSLISLNSRYDRYAHGDESALSAKEQRGHTVFRSFVTRCSQCHTPPLFTNQQLAVTGAPEFVDQGFDTGAEKVLGMSQLRGAFKVPGLRNVDLTAPYMHSGALEDLQAVISFYNDERGHAVKGRGLQLHWHMVNPGLSKAEESALIAFLLSLRDESNKPNTPALVPSGLLVVKAMQVMAAQNNN
jgi:cytochrome c peroxidase